MAKNPDNTGQPDNPTSENGGETPSAPKPRVRKPRLTAAQRALRDSAIVAGVHAGHERKQIARDNGITLRQVERIVAGFEVRRTALEDAPMEIIERVLRTYEQQLHDYLVMAADTVDRAPAVSIAAMKGHAEALERYVTLLSDVGKLPDNLELFRSESEMQRLAQGLVDRLHLIMAGDLTPADVIEWLERETAPRAVIGSALELPPGESDAVAA